MFKNIGLSTKITALLLLVVAVALGVIGYFSWEFSRAELQDKYRKEIDLLAEQKSAEIGAYISKAKDGITLLANLRSLKESLDQLQSGTAALEELEAGNNNPGDPFASDDMAIDIFDAVVEQDPLYDEKKAEYQDQIERASTVLKSTVESFGDQSEAIAGVLLLDDKKKALAGEAGSFSTKTHAAMLTFAEEPFNMSPAFEEEGNYFFYLSKKINGSAAILVAKVRMTQVLAIVNAETGIGKSSEVVLGEPRNERIWFLNSRKYVEEKPLEGNVTRGMESGGPIQMAVDGDAGSATLSDYRGKKVLAAWRPVAETNWGLVAKIDASEVQASLSTLKTKLLISYIVILFCAGFIAYVFSGWLVSPLVGLKANMQMLSKGILPARIEKRSDDEIGQMAVTVNDVIYSLRRTAEFAQNIGQGKFDAEFDPMSEDDTLGNALIDMRDSIQEAEARDKERNWIVTGVAEVGEILRMHNELEQLGDDVAAFVTEKINAVQGAFYVVNDDDNDNLFLEMKASYAYNKKKYLKATYKFAEGLVGQAAVEEDTILRTEIPHDYVSITSGLLGDRRPECLLLVPMITEEKVYGVLEFAGFEKFTPRQVKFVQEISVIIARTVFNIKVNERTKRHLEESQKLSHELQIQQNELRQNAEEMAATQEELKRTNQRLEEQIEEVNRTQNRMQLLLENASEVISIYEEDATLRYISPSVEKILGYSQNEVIGQKDDHHIHEDYRDAFREMFSLLIENPFETQTLQFQYQTKSGEFIWLEATGKNLLQDPSIQGLIVNTTDITERRRAEQEERMRSKMQSLSENSPDLITRLDASGHFFYINPVIEEYTGKKPEHFLNKTLKEVELEPAIVNEWSAILQEVEDKDSKVSREVDFPTELGERIMQVNAIPEYDDDEHIESVLVVSHDITERKLIELEIASKNKKISESINYAKRIQGAILPNNQIIQRVLPDSFIIYKPRDVVSGDFPWFMQVGDDIFFAAVDCTGHGVPGALISLIGYFLLNDIVRSRKISDPGKILDMLDEGVTQTLRQDQEGAATRDGMDIALCRINTKTNQLDYAGAHRPLYILKGEELTEVKGDKWPIGGGIYRNQTNFTNTSIHMEKGDSVYFCSDGFPDQFGGPDNRKFGPKRLRNTIHENGQKSMEEIYHVLDESWEEWKGDQKQTDDVLLIGIRF